MITDHLGSVRLVVNATTGAVTQRLDYDEFGRVTQDTSPGFQPFGFAGGLYDAQTGLVRFGARDYDSTAGRWTAKEVLGFGGGNANWYGYVMNDPINLIDPNGLQGVSTGPPIINIGPDGVSAGPVTVGRNGVGLSPTALVGNDPFALLTKIWHAQAELAALKKIRDALGKYCPIGIKEKIKDLQNELNQLQSQFNNLKLQIGSCSPLSPGGPTIPSVYFQ